MEQKKSKVTSVVQGQDWVGKQGVFHTWTVRFENGDVGGNMTKQGNNCAFKVGETVDYTIAEQTTEELVQAGLIRQFTAAVPVGAFETGVVFGE